LITQAEKFIWMKRKLDCGKYMYRITTALWRRDTNFSHAAGVLFDDMKASTPHVYRKLTLSWERIRSPWLFT
jgi:hypothetical protein